MATERRGYCFSQAQACKYINVISLGAGVQSSTMALMAAQGLIKPMPVVAIFADTGYEPRAVYEWLDKLSSLLPYPVARVSAGDLKTDQLRAVELGGPRKQGDRYATIPAYTQRGGKMGRIRRQCTREYKIRPIIKYIREEILGVGYYKHTPRTPKVVQWRGISVDEASRMRPANDPWMLVRYPLIELGTDRAGCKLWCKRNGYGVPPRSACLCCPFHSDAEWLDIKGRADDWADVIAFDAAIRGQGGEYGHLYLHRRCKPLDQIEFADSGMGGFWPEECTGYCGV